MASWCGTFEEESPIRTRPLHRVSRHASSNQHSQWGSPPGGAAAVSTAPAWPTSYRNTEALAALRQSASRAHAGWDEILSTQANWGGAAARPQELRSIFAPSSSGPSARSVATFDSATVGGASRLRLEVDPAMAPPPLPGAHQLDAWSDDSSQGGVGAAQEAPAPAYDERSKEEVGPEDGANVELQRRDYPSRAVELTALADGAVEFVGVGSGRHRNDSEALYDDVDPLLPGGSPRHLLSPQHRSRPIPLGGSPLGPPISVSAAPHPQQLNRVLESVGTDELAEGLQMLGLAEGGEACRQWQITGAVLAQLTATGWERMFEDLRITQVR